jgi:predicted RNase H-like nuclease (RuvC/YqgF family)
MMLDMCNFPPSEETAKHSSFDELSAKVKVLEAENESLKTFIQESSNKETEAKKELSEKHARVLADLNEKLEKSQGRVISLVAKNKVLEAEAEAIDQLIFRKLFSVSLLRLSYMLSL